MTLRDDQFVAAWLTDTNQEFPNVWDGFIPRWLEWLLLTIAAVCLAVGFVSRPFRWLWRLVRGEH